DHTADYTAAGGWRNIERVRLPAPPAGLRLLHAELAVRAHQPAGDVPATRAHSDGRRNRPRKYGDWGRSRLGDLVGIERWSAGGRRVDARRGEIRRYVHDPGK